jgi:hypothetical protein
VDSILSNAYTCMPVLYKLHLLDDRTFHIAVTIRYLSKHVTRNMSSSDMIDVGTPWRHELNIFNKDFCYFARWESYRHVNPLTPESLQETLPDEIFTGDFPSLTVHFVIQGYS